MSRENTRFRVESSEYNVFKRRPRELQESRGMTPVLVEHIGKGFQPTEYDDYRRYRSLRFFSRISFHNRSGLAATRSIEYTSSLS
jgi:hypothetical protein